jgi:hypothetical protein
VRIKSSGLGEECGGAIVGIERDIGRRLTAKDRSTEMENMLVVVTTSYGTQVGTEY